MINVSGTYKNGKIILDEKASFKSPVKVLVTFIDEDVEVESKRLTLDDFAFAKSRELLKRLKTSLSDAVIEERRGIL